MISIENYKPKNQKPKVDILQKLVTLIFVLYFSSSTIAQVYIVNTTDDAVIGSCDQVHCSLREAIIEANNSPGLIAFNIAGAGQQTINLQSELPNLFNNNITIDATTQPNWYNGIIEIVGSTFFNGLHVQGNNISVFGLRFVDFSTAILIDTTNVQSDITIGGPGKGNSFFDNGFGVRGATDNLSDVMIQSNVFGDSFSSNSAGVYVEGQNTSNIIIGGSKTQNRGNTFRGHTQMGIWVTNNVEIYGNDIWLNVVGIVLDGSDNVVGGSSDFSNSISDNFSFGITIYDPPFIQNTISQNSIFCNVNGAVFNNGNNNIAPPIIQSTGSSISGTGPPNSTVELFYDQSNCTVCQPQTYLGSAVVNNLGMWSFGPTTITGNILASVTDSNGNTSSFSSCVNQDECAGAYELPLDANDCPTDFTIFSLETATPSAEPYVGCTPFLGQSDARDIWTKSTVPASGALMLQMIPDYTFMNPMVEVYTGTCGTLTFEKCDSLFAYPHQFPIAELTPGDDIYFRIFDKFDLFPQNVALNLMQLPTDTADWIICEDIVENRTANEFIVQYEAGLSAAQIQTITNDLIAEGATLIDECECTDPSIQLWRASTPVELECTKLTARNKADVDGTDYNFLLEDQTCHSQNIVTSLVYVPGPNGGFFQVIVTEESIEGQCANQADFVPLGLPYNPQVNDPQVNVAIIDSGFDQNNPHLNNATWNNPASPDGANCYLNDNSGYDFLNQIGNVVDAQGHGTSVAGVAVNDFNQNVNMDLMNLKFFESDNGTLFKAICAIYYAANNGADVMNLSWGFLLDGPIPKTLEDALNYARQRDVLVVTSAGNREKNIDVFSKYPANANFANIITVGSFQLEGGTPSLSPFSNYGNLNVDLLANGSVEVMDINTMTKIESGTSFSAPLVTKTAAEIRAKYPALSSTDVKDCILSSVDVYSSLASVVASGGVLNHAAALDCAYNKAITLCGGPPVVYTDTHTQDTLIATDLSISSTGIVPSPLESNYHAAQYIDLDGGFEVELGATFLATIENCSASVPAP
jgi:CSLREA domain-containing protein